MRTSQYLLSTLKETPADAEVISHQLMLRAGMIRKLASGLYTLLNLAKRWQWSSVTTPWEALASIVDAFHRRRC